MFESSDSLSRKTRSLSLTRTREKERCSLGFRWIWLLKSLVEICHWHCSGTIPEGETISELFTKQRRTHHIAGDLRIGNILQVQFQSRKFDRQRSDWNEGRRRKRKRRGRNWQRRRDQRSFGEIENQRIALRRIHGIGRDLKRRRDNCSTRFRRERERERETDLVSSDVIDGDRSGMCSLGESARCCWNGRRKRRRRRRIVHG